ncbi:MAG: acyl--CoA ligase [Bacteroidales bacterium]|nr:acyl--CoA ligase [Bacteroidales bacterium]
MTQTETRTQPEAANSPAGLEELTRRALSQAPSLPAIEFEKRWITWGEMRHVADRLGALIDASGAGASPKIAFVARNRPSALAAFLGMLARSCSVRMLYPFQSAEAIAREIRRIDPAIVVAAEEDYAEPIFAALREQGIAAVSLSDMDAAPRPGFEHTRHRDDSASPPTIDILTSGTTGAPKPFPISYDMVAHHIVGASAAFLNQNAAAESPPPALAMFPVSNISGLYSTLPALLSGQQVAMLDRFTVAGWHDFILRYRPLFSGMPPAGVQMVLDADIPREDLAGLRGLGTGAAPLDPGVQRAFEERYGVPIMLSYGATEFCGPVAAMTPALHATFGNDKLGSAGRAMQGMQLRVVDVDTGEPLPAGREGILEVLCPRIGEEWIRTSDIGVLDEDDFLFLRGRADCAIMRGGFKILPATIEHALLDHPAISMATAVDVADRRLGQVPGVAIQLRPGAEQPTIADVEAHLRRQLPATHIPVHWLFVDEMPRTPSMKVDLPAVRRLFEEKPGSGG